MLSLLFERLMKSNVPVAIIQIIYGVKQILLPNMYSVLFKFNCLSNKNPIWNYIQSIFFSGWNKGDENWNFENSKLSYHHLSYDIEIIWNNFSNGLCHAHRINLSIILILYWNPVFFQWKPNNFISLQIFLKHAYIEY